MWERTVISTECGKTDAIMPVIVSASRATDIPAFYSEWFMNRLGKGHVKWVNPFNGKPLYVSFEKTRVVVFWTKNPEPMLPRLKEIDSRGLNHYFLFTLNDYDEENLEPRVPRLKDRADTFARLAGMVGKERVVWRFDPLILTDRIGRRRLADKVYGVAKQIAGNTQKLVFSFADIDSYKKVRRNLLRHGIAYRDFSPEDVEYIALALRKIGNEFNLEIASCAEPYDLEEFGITHNQCIDGRLMARIFPGDAELMRFLCGGKLKDKGQRKACGCIAAKDIGRYGTCAHLCRYCYANPSEETVLKNIAGIDADGESIAG